MRKINLTFLLTILMSMVGVKALAYDIAVENADGVKIYYNYINNGLELEVTRPSNSWDRYSSGSVVIPESVTYMNITRKVTSIGTYAFAGSFVTSVAIPNSVTSIGNNAFSSCSYLTWVAIPNSVTSIGNDAFFYCKKLLSITIGNCVTSIGIGVFEGCDKLQKVIVKDIAAWCKIKFGNRGSYNSLYSNPLCYAHHLYSDEDTEILNLVIPNSVTNIESFAFSGCTGLTSVTIPNSVTNIESCAFSGCTGLTSVTIPNSVTSVSRGAFGGCSGLTSVTIPNSVTSIGESAFDHCTGLTSVTIPNSVTSIGSSAFYGCSSLTSITIPNSVTSIDGKAFYRCSGLTSVTIGNGVTSIGESAFDGCLSLTSVTIPNSVTTIGAYAFRSCTGLTSVTIPNSVTSIGESAFSGCSGLTSVTIGNGVTTIGSYAFYECTGLTSVTIPNSVTSIDGKAFYRCSGLTSVTIGNSVAIIGSYAFNCENLATVVSLIKNPLGIELNTFSQNTKIDGTLYVPVGTKEKYKVTAGWQDFQLIKEGTGGNGSDPSTPETEACKKPTISYQNGKLTFYSETEGATCVSSITDDDMGTYTANEVQLGVTYDISVYATKAGYENSETVTATLCWIDQQPKTEGVTSVTNISANAVLMKSEAGMLTVEGADDGTLVSVYGINGVQAGSAVSQNGQATINTNLQTGSVAIVKIGQRSVKIMMK